MPRRPKSPSTPSTAAGPGADGSPAAPGGGKPRFPLRSVLVNPVSLGYLALAGAAVLFAAGDALLGSHEDASMAGVWVMLVAAPTVFVLLFTENLFWEAGEGPTWFLLLVIAVSALIQAVLLGACLRAFRRRAAATEDDWHNPAHGDS
ncbi:hypothetical protein QNO07_15100 [Streptomyces sp. 549]|uniref:SCO4225 family membrane protein n=1 Tax=Streptomyces sp. 549 TaxID=3049076 RepID=UPI0024C219A4|nr:hypothetical protein [Streptomyces sp. 549]MDK1474733.1 hypothetical protein [Streptomyces sp. 549]